MQRQFYATANDLEPIFEHTESKRALAYTPMGSFDSLPIPSALSGRALPTLGRRLTNTSAACGPCYLVADSSTPINSDRFVIKTGEIRYAVDQLLNPDTVTFQHGGLYDDNIFLYGSVGTASDSEASVKLYRLFSSALAKAFVKVQAAYVGPEALAMLRRGCRLTIGAQSPSKFDLRNA